MDLAEIHSSVDSFWDPSWSLQPPSYLLVVDDYRPVATVYCRFPWPRSAVPDHDELREIPKIGFGVGIVDAGSVQRL